MKIQIAETGVITQLSLMKNKNDEALRIISFFEAIDVYCAGGRFCSAHLDELSTGFFTYDMSPEELEYPEPINLNAEKRLYLCTQETFDIWTVFLSDYRKLLDRRDKLSELYGEDAVSDAEYRVRHRLCNFYIGDMNTALDKAFGATA